MSRRTSLRAALLVASAACAVSALPASALAAGAELDEPVPGSVIVQANGLEWVWASPCPQNGCTSGIRVGKDGFEFATADQWALRPAVADFGGTKCAAPWLDEQHSHCDYTDPDVGAFGSAPVGGQPAGPDGLQAMEDGGETWLVRAAPPAPTLTGFAPASPSSSNTPSVTGTAEPGSTVRLYTTSDCTGTAVATGTAAEFADPGLSVSVASDATTTFYATATNAGDQSSACSAGLNYVEVSTAPVAPPVPGATATAAPAADRLAPTSTIAAVTRSQRRSRRVTLSGTAGGTGSAVQVVRISVARVVGKLCRFLQEDGTFSTRRSCARTTYLTATGKDTWSLALRKLPKGSYKVRSRAIDAAGNVERKDASRNLLRFRL